MGSAATAATMTRSKWEGGAGPMHTRQEDSSAGPVEETGREVFMSGGCCEPTRQGHRGRGGAVPSPPPGLLFAGEAEKPWQGRWAQCGPVPQLRPQEPSPLPSSPAPRPHQLSPSWCWRRFPCGGLRLCPCGGQPGQAPPSASCARVPPALGLGMPLVLAWVSVKHAPSS